MPDELRPGAALVKLRWDKSTPEDRTEHGRMMAEARWTKYRAEHPELEGEGMRPRKRRKPRAK